MTLLLNFLGTATGMKQAVYNCYYKYYLYESMNSTSSSYRSTRPFAWLSTVDESACLSGHSVCSTRLYWPYGVARQLPFWRFCSRAVFTWRRRAHSRLTTTFGCRRTPNAILVRKNLLLLPR